jgi:hypothetical protein
MMGSRRLLLIVALAVGLVVIVLGARSLLRGELTEEEVLTALVQKLGQAAEKREVKLLREHLSRRYHDEKGRRHAEISQLLTYYFLRRGVISVFLVRSKVVGIDRTATPLSAQVTTTAVLARGPRIEKLKDVLPHAARALRFELTFEKEEEETWRVVSASWRDAGSVRDFLGGQEP